MTSFAELEERYHELARRLSDPQVIGQPAEYARAAKARAELAEVVEKFDEYKTLLARLPEARRILAEDADREMRELAQAEVDDLERGQSSLEEALAANSNPMATKRSTRSGSTSIICRRWWSVTGTPWKRH